MELTKNEFLVLDALRKESSATQRSIASNTKLSVGTVNSVIKQLESRGFIDTEIVHVEGLSKKGLDALEPYRVENAIIMAAGLSSRFAPISYEKPKGLLTVKGEILIERQIRQLKEVGIDDIVVVVGYKKEYFFYLEDKFGVRLVINEDYATRNNNSSLYVVRDYLRNSYICSSDNYFSINPFNAYEWSAFYSAEYAEGYTKEWCIQTGPHGRITSVEIGGEDSLYMIGHAYFDRLFSKQFKKILEAEYDTPETADMLWEELFLKHASELTMYAKEFDAGIIYEFDSLDELREFDPFFLENVDSEAFDNIANVLECTKSEIHDIYPLKQGLTNLSCHFKTDEGEYVYRHPGIGTEQLIDRNAEVKAQEIAKRLGIDDTFIFEDPEKGWKLSKFIPDAKQLDPHDDGQLATAMQIARKLHGEEVNLERRFDFYQEAKRYESLLKNKEGIDVPGYFDMAAKIDRLHDFVMQDETFECLCHNDFFYLNLLIDGSGEVSLIDWEYSGISDYANDFGTFVVTCQLAEGEALRALHHYFGREPTVEEIRHNFAFVAFAGWCWYVWSLVKEAEGDCVGEWLYIYYKYAKEYVEKATLLYEK